MTQHSDIGRQLIQGCDSRKKEDKVSLMITLGLGLKALSGRAERGNPSREWVFLCWGEGYWSLKRLSHRIFKEEHQRGRNHSDKSSRNLYGGLPRVFVQILSCGPAQIAQFVGSIVPMHPGWGFDPQSGHVQEATNESINRWNNKLISLSFKSTNKNLLKPRNTKLCMYRVKLYECGWIITTREL